MTAILDPVAAAPTADLTTPKRGVLLAPHHDDETLFAGFLALRDQPDLIVVTRADVQAARGAPVSHEDRCRETAAAWQILNPGRDWTQWHYTDVPGKADEPAIRRQVADLARIYDYVIAPAVETAGGHPHHDLVGSAALDAFSDSRTIFYTTYTRHEGRSTWGVPVVIEDPDWIIAKLRALTCHVSQIREPTTRPWFLGELNEWTA